MLAILEAMPQLSAVGNALKTTSLEEFTTAFAVVLKHVSFLPSVQLFALVPLVCNLPMRYTDISNAQTSASSPFDNSSRKLEMLCAGTERSSSLRSIYMKELVQ